MLIPTKAFAVAKMIRRETKYLSAIPPRFGKRPTRSIRISKGMLTLSLEYLFSPNLQSLMSDQTIIEQPIDPVDAGAPNLTAVARGRGMRIFFAVVRGFNALVAFLFLLGLLSVTASLPVGNVLTLGYLMEVQGRMARNGKFRSALFLLPEAQRLGTIALGIALWMIPVHFVATLARDSRLLSPDSPASWLLMVGLILTSLFVALHLTIAIGCGGRWWQFLRPIRNVRSLLKQYRSSGFWRNAQEKFLRFFAAFQFLQLAKLGLLAYVAVYVWLVIPAYLFTQLDDVTIRWQVVGFVVGCITMTLTLMWLPMILVHVAVSGRPGAMFDHKSMRRLTQQLPLRWMMATVILYGLSVLPLLYVALVKATIPPHRIEWDMMVVFLLTAIPTRILMGWVYHRGMRLAAAARLTESSQRNDDTYGLANSAAATATGNQPKPGWLRVIWHFANAAILLVGLVAYVYFLNLAQTGGELGDRSVWQFHALLLPFPFH